MIVVQYAKKKFFSIVDLLKLAASLLVRRTCVSLRLVLTAYGFLLTLRYVLTLRNITFTFFERKTTMKFILLIAADEAKEAAMNPAEMDQIVAAYGPYTNALMQAGVLVAGERLKASSNATTVRIRDGKTSVLDGPYADTKEQLGGFYIIDVADLDAALTWAARCPSAPIGSIEVRPIWSM